MENYKILHRWPLAVTLLLLFGMSSCDSTNPTADLSSLSVSFATKGTGMQKDHSLQSTHLTITEAKMLIRKIEFENDVEDDGIPDDSLEFEAGPLVVNLQLDGSVNSIAVSNVDPGSYDEIEFEVHKPEDNETPPDPEFKVGTSGDERFSVIVRGSYNGQDFLYRSRVNMEQEIALAQPLILQENQEANVTLTVDLSQWFVDQQGNELDPTIVENQDAIDESIKRSFEGFEDHDMNGIDD